MDHYFLHHYRRISWKISKSRIRVCRHPRKEIENAVILEFFSNALQFIYQVLGNTERVYFSLRQILLEHEIFDWISKVNILIEQQLSRIYHTSIEGSLRTSD